MRISYFTLLILASLASAQAMRPPQGQTKPLKRRDVGDGSADRPLPPRGGGLQLGMMLFWRKNITGGDASTLSSVLNLVNNVAGAGILALAAARKGTGTVPSLLMCAGLGLISAQSFCLIGEACSLMDQGDFKGLWAQTLGERTTFIVDSMIAILCLAVSVIYSGILGDVFGPLLHQYAGIDLSRRAIILILTATILLPLSLVTNLSALAFASTLGFGSILYTVGFMALRALDGSYSAVNDAALGRFIDDKLALRPSFEFDSAWNMDPTHTLVLMSTLGLAYVAHYNAPNFYRELQRTSPKRFRRMVLFAFSILVVLYTVTMESGYRTFGDACYGNILLNYHPHDVLGTLGRVATGLSVLFGFPLIMTGARESLWGVASSFYKDRLGSREAPHTALVLGILAGVTAVACAVTDVSLVVGLAGATLGSFIVYICPALLYYKAVSLTYGNCARETLWAKLHAIFLVPFGLWIAVAGVKTTLHT